MPTLSRRALANYAVDSMIAGQKGTETARQLAAVLIISKRTGQLEQLAEDIAYELEERKLQADARVTSATKIDGGIIAQIEKFIKAETGAKAVSLTQQHDESLIGGVVIETAKFRWDQTIKRKLTDIREAFSPAKL